MAKSKPASGSPSGLPRSTIAVATVGIIFTGLMTFTILKWVGSRDAAAALREEIEEASVDEAALREELAPLSSQYDRLKNRTDVLGVGRLTVCNASDEPVTISQVASVYFAEDGSFQTFNSRDHGHGLWSLDAGDVRELSFPAAGWDGSVTYYALWINDLVPYAGVWPLKSGYCVRHIGG